MKQANITNTPITATPIPNGGVGDGGAGGNDPNDYQAFYGGTDIIVPYGEPVRVGGWSNVLNVDLLHLSQDNAITVNGTVHIHYQYVEDYLNSDGPKVFPWARHEFQHIIQQEVMENNPNPTGFWDGAYWIAQVAGSYVPTLSHDGSPLERDANNAAGISYLDPYGAGIWPALPHLYPVGIPPLYPRTLKIR